MTDRFFIFWALLAITAIAATVWGRRHPGSWAWRNLAAKRAEMHENGNLYPWSKMDFINSTKERIMPNVKPNGSPLGENEPVFTLRAKDNAMLPTLYSYEEHAQRVGASREFLKEVHDIILAVHKWRANHIDECKVPD